MCALGRVEVKLRTRAGEGAIHCTELSFPSHRVPNLEYQTAADRAPCARLWRNRFASDSASGIRPEQSLPLTSSRRVRLPASLRRLEGGLSGLWELHVAPVSSQRQAGPGAGTTLRTHGATPFGNYLAKFRRRCMAIRPVLHAVRSPAHNPEDGPLPPRREVAQHGTPCQAGLQPQPPGHHTERAAALVQHRQAWELTSQGAGAGLRSW